MPVFSSAKSSTNEAGIIQPSIELADGGVRVTVWRRPAASHVADDVADDVADEYTERQLLIMDVLKKNVADDVADDVADKAIPNTKYLADLLGVSRKTIQRDLSLLQAKDVVRWTGTDRSGYWVLVSLPHPDQPHNENDVR